MPRPDRETSDVLLRRTIEALLDEQLTRAGDDFFFLQIGAHDGVSFDWVYSFVTRHRVRGVVVEPLRDMFERLCANYRDDAQIVPVNVAIHRTARTIPIYRVDPAKAAGLPEWAPAIASVDPEHHRKSGTPSDVIITETAPCLTMQELIDRQNITRIDFLQIDVEGYDHEIIRRLDFTTLKPAIIRFEHNLAKGVMTRADFLACQDLLLSAGYLLLMDPVDAVAYLPDGT